MTTPSEFEFEGLRMHAAVDATGASLFVSIASGFAEFEVKVPLAEKDLQVLQADSERSAFLQAALHHPFQLRETALSEIEQRRYLDIILHSPVADVEAFLTTLDHGLANGAISNMLRITRGRNQQAMRSGAWFA
ncbi:hypothetical protein CHU94_01590 [Rhodoferax sp. TH121]|uniref:hypothetical protein n=1 Tax=Rhodoferax sp. TH121 TaxID=2022803 RepID=UPI000B96C277|nr:hypothetical protein [Rhodoferax sp. TH121]OYQ42672.1 hypothetical protein CHU94_01590 [Rhodoferax sp. TH121]